MFLRESENAMIAIGKQYSADDLKGFMKTEYTELCQYYFSVGLWIRNNLLQENNSLYRLFICKGVLTPDDMSALLINLFYLYLHTESRYPNKTA